MSGLSFRSTGTRPRTKSRSGRIGGPGINSEHPFIAGLGARVDHAVVVLPVRKGQQRHVAAEQLRKLVPGCVDLLAEACAVDPREVGMAETVRSKFDELRQRPQLVAGHDLFVDPVSDLPAGLLAEKVDRYEDRCRESSAEKLGQSIRADAPERVVERNRHVGATVRERPGVRSAYDRRPARERFHLASEASSSLCRNLVVVEDDEPG